MSNYEYDLVVIGAGSGGVRAARMSAAKGARVAVIENKYLGGTCVNVGCVPKKLRVYAAEYSEHIRDAQGFGWNVDGSAFDWATLIQNKNTEIERLNGVYERLLNGAGVDIITGTAQVLDGHCVKVGDRVMSGRYIVVATGGWPFKPEFPGHELAITSNEFFFLQDTPKSALVLGGGYIAVELAGILNGLGVETTLVYRGDMFLRGFDEDIRRFVANELEQAGINLRFGVNIAGVSSENGGARQVALTDGSTLTVSEVLCATGRKPNTTGLGLEQAGVEMGDKGQIIVDEHFCTSIASVYAIGDVIDRVQLTPVALAEGMYLSEYLFGDGARTPAVDYEDIPTAVFCQPNIGTVGLTEEQARARGLEIDIYKSDFKPMKNTLSGNHQRCLMKLIVEQETGKVLGVHMVGHEAGEIIQGIAVAVKAGATKHDFDRTIGIHPTAAEEFVTMRQKS